MPTTLPQLDGDALWRGNISTCTCTDAFDSAALVNLASPASRGAASGTDVFGQLQLGLQGASAPRSPSTPPIQRGMSQLAQTRRFSSHTAISSQIGMSQLAQTRWVSSLTATFPHPLCLLSQMHSVTGTLAQASLQGHAMASRHHCCARSCCCSASTCAFCCGGSSSICCGVSDMTWFSRAAGMGGRRRGMFDTHEPSHRAW